MIRALIALLLSVPLFAQIPSPSQHLKLEIGKDRVLADYKQIRDYFRALDAASPRVEVQVLGKTTEGQDIIMAVISSEENMRNLARIREIAKKLADPRGLSDAEAETLIAKWGDGATENGRASGAAAADQGKPNLSDGLAAD